MGTHVKQGLFLVAIGLLCLWLFIRLTGIAEAKTGSTPRDLQRLGACMAESIRPDNDPKTWDSEVVECAAMGKAVSHIESAKGSSAYAKLRNNHYGIRQWDKNGKPHIRKFKDTAAADAEWARLYYNFYRGYEYTRFAKKWTGEPHIVKSYTAHLAKYVPQYRILYRSILASK